MDNNTVELKKRIALLEETLQEKEHLLKVLQDSEKRYRRLFESAKDGILILDAETGKVVDVNPYLLQLLGYPGLKILFMSGYTANVISQRGVLDNGINFIQKPFSLKELAVKVRKALD